MKLKFSFKAKRSSLQSLTLAVLMAFLLLCPFAEAFAATCGSAGAEMATFPKPSTRHPPSSNFCSSGAVWTLGVQDVSADYFAWKCQDDNANPGNAGVFCYAQVENTNGSCGLGQKCNYLFQYNYDAHESDDCYDVLTQQNIDYILNRAGNRYDLVKLRQRDFRSTSNGCSSPPTETETIDDADQTVLTFYSALQPTSSSPVQQGSDIAGGDDFNVYTTNYIRYYWTQGASDSPDLCTMSGTLTDSTGRTKEQIKNDCLGPYSDADLQGYHVLMGNMTGQNVVCVGNSSIATQTCGSGDTLAWQNNPACQGSHPVCSDSAAQAFCCSYGCQHSGGTDAVAPETISDTTYSRAVTQCQNHAAATCNGGRVATAVTVNSGSCGTTPVNGACNNAARNGCSAGSPNDGAYPDTAGEYRWRCDGTDGGTGSAVCSMPIVINGSCDNSGTNRCAAGTLVDDADTGTEYVWHCDGINGGSTSSSCTRSKSIDGVCSSSTNNGCASGTLVDDADDSANYLWHCDGIGGGDSSGQCTKSKTTSGVCGFAHGNEYGAAPSGAALCSVGSASAVSGTGPWNWTCSDGGTPANCAANVCGRAEGICNNAIRNGCTSGNTNDVAHADTDTEFRWQCDGTNGGGNSVMCVLPKTCLAGP